MSTVYDWENVYLRPDSTEATSSSSRYITLLVCSMTALASEANKYSTTLSSFKGVNWVVDWLRASLPPTTALVDITLWRGWRSVGMGIISVIWLRNWKESRERHALHPKDNWMRGQSVHRKPSNDTIHCNTIYTFESVFTSLFRVFASHEVNDESNDRNKRLNILKKP